MSKVLLYLSTTLCTFCMAYSFSEEILASGEEATEQVAEFSSSLNPQQLNELPVKTTVSVKPTQQIPFSPFTGKVKGKKLRLRVKPDLESHVIKELDKGEFLSVVGEKDQFWAVQAPTGIKAYIFRSFVLENVVEGNRVNIRLEPDLEAPIIGHLNSGDKINGSISSQNNKWLEIAVPEQTTFYVIKEYIENIGGPELKLKHENRRQTVQQLLESTALLTKAEFRKTYQEIDIDRLHRTYQSLISEYNDFPEYIEQAKEALVYIQEAYTQKKIAFLESKAMAKETITNRDLSDAITEEDYEPLLEVAKIAESSTDKMKLWEPIEEALYLSWTRMNEERSLEEYYEDQSLTTAVPLSGILEAFTAPIKNKPGDYILRQKDLPVAYLYSTQINLQNLVGKKVTLLGAPRPNNHFAFPAYFILSAE